MSRRHLRPPPRLEGRQRVNGSLGISQKPASSPMTGDEMSEQQAREARVLLLRMMAAVLEGRGPKLTEDDMRRPVPGLIIDAVEGGLGVRFPTAEEAAFLRENFGMVGGLSLAPRPATMAMLMRMTAAGLEAEQRGER